MEIAVYCDRRGKMAVFVDGKEAQEIKTFSVDSFDGKVFALDNKKEQQ